MADPDHNTHHGASESGERVVIPCPLEEVERHLRAFITAFVLPDAQARWLAFLIEKRPEWDVPLPKTHPSSRTIKITRKADEVMGQFAVDRRYCAKLPNAQRTAAYFDSTVGKAPGVYFAVGEPPCKMSAVDADRQFAWDNSNALLSFQAGRKALFFRHDDGIWLCEKQQASSRGGS
jgi:hypothetical protein